MKRTISAAHNPELLAALSSVEPRVRECSYLKRSHQEEQEAQLSQRDRATLCVIEYFAKLLNSLKVIRNDILEKGMCKSLLVSHCNYVCTSYCF